MGTGEWGKGHPQARGPGLAPEMCVFVLEGTGNPEESQVSGSGCKSPCFQLKQPRLVLLPAASCHVQSSMVPTSSPYPALGWTLEMLPVSVCTHAVTQR